MISILILEGNVALPFCFTLCSASMKIWQTVMAMREESKQVQDAVYEAIMKGWVQGAVNPLLEIPYLVSSFFPSVIQSIIRTN